jgi:hypothetical protein
MAPRNDPKDGADNVKPEKGMATLATLRYVRLPALNVA